MQRLTDHTYDRSPMARKLLTGAASVISLAAGAARHVAWYINYQVQGATRTEKRMPAEDD
jgi:hypothetical protein